MFRSSKSKVKPFTNENGTTKTVRFSDEVLDVPVENITREFPGEKITMENGSAHKRRANRKKGAGSPKLGSSPYRLYLLERLMHLKE